MCYGPKWTYQRGERGLFINRVVLQLCIERFAEFSLYGYSRLGRPRARTHTHTYARTPACDHLRPIPDPRLDSLVLSHLQAYKRYGRDGISEYPSPPCRIVEQVDDVTRWIEGSTISELVSQRASRIRQELVVAKLNRFTLRVSDSQRGRRLLVKVYISPRHHRG